MAEVKVKALKAGDVIKSYAIFNDEKWHFVRNVGPGNKPSKVYLALEDYGSGQFSEDEVVEKK